MRAGSVAENSAVWRVGRRALEDLLDVLGEPHVEHLVRLVEHEHANAVETQCLAADVIQCAARRGDDDVRAAIEGADLLLHGRAAVERDDDDAGPVRVLVDRLADLHRQLARRDEDETAGGPAARCFLPTSRGRSS